MIQSQFPVSTRGHPYQAVIIMVHSLLERGCQDTVFSGAIRCGRCPNCESTCGPLHTGCLWRNMLLQSFLFLFLFMKDDFLSFAFKHQIASNSFLSSLTSAVVLTVPTTFIQYIWYKTFKCHNNRDVSNDKTKILWK